MALASIGGTGIFRGVKSSISLIIFAHIVFSLLLPASGKLSQNELIIAIWGLWFAGGGWVM
jgi:hypothetical protein